MFKVITLLLLLSVSARAQIVGANAADLSSQIAPGSIAILFFGDFGTTESSQAQSLPLPFTLGGLSLKIGGKNAPLFAVSPSQVKFLVPLNAPIGVTEIDLTRPDGRHVGGWLYLTEQAPAVFAGMDYQDRGFAVMVTLWATGIQIERCPNIQLRVGRLMFTPVYVGQSEYAGVGQLNFLVPKSLLTGIPNNNALMADGFTSSGLTLRFQ